MSFLKNFLITIVHKLIFSRTSRGFASRYRGMPAADRFSRPDPPNGRVGTHPAASSGRMRVPWERMGGPTPPERIGFCVGTAPLAFNQPAGPLPEKLLGDRRRSNRGPGEARNHARQVVASVEPVFEFAEVALRVLPLHGMVGAPKRRLDVADDGVKPDEFLDEHGGPPAAGDDGDMQAAGRRDSSEARQAVAVDPASRRDVPAAPALDRLQPEAGHRPELDLVRQPLPGRLQPRDEGSLARRSAPSLAFPELAQLDVVHLDQSRERLLVLALHHRLHDLVLHAPGRVVGNADLAHEVHRRDALLALRDQENGLEPGRERQLGVLEQRSGRDRGLPTALGALPKVPAIEPAVPRAAAGGAIESRGPAQLRQRFGAFLLGAVELQKGRKAHSFLELHLVSLSHGFSRRVYSMFFFILEMFRSRKGCCQKIHLRTMVIRKNLKILKNYTILSSFSK